jgi:hypothetical protein
MHLYFARSEVKKGVELEFVLPKRTADKRDAGARGEYGRKSLAGDFGAAGMQLTQMA